MALLPSSVETDEALDALAQDSSLAGVALAE
jgi:hypothetical protein